jgi:hypothetical protein
MWRGQPAATITATLNSYGRVPWATLTQALHGATTAWADYDGFHIGEAPEIAPPYTHLWAWADAWMLRARIDDGQAIVATLHLADAAPPGITPCTPASTVTVTHLQSRTWLSGEHRIGPIASNVADQPVDLCHIDGAHPVTFVRLAPAQADQS